MSRPLALLAALAFLFAPASHAEELTPEEKHAITMAFLEGNPEHVYRYAPEEPRAEAWFPVLLYEHWWRPTAQPGAPKPRMHTDAFLKDGPHKATGLTAKRIAWIAAPLPKPPFPMPAPDQPEPWPALTALVRDRLVREAQGLEGVLRENPLGALAASFRKQQDAGTLSDHEEHQLWWIDLARNDFSYSYQGDPPTAEQRQMLEAGRAVADRNLIVALIALLLLITAPIVIGLRAGRSTESA